MVQGSEEASAKDAVFVHSVQMPETSTRIQGIDFNELEKRKAEGRSSDISVREMAKMMSNVGFQASNLGKAVDIIEQMRDWRPNAQDIENGCEESDRTTVFLGYTSNLVSSGLRETIRYLVEHKHVQAICATAGGVEEDLIKCLAPTFLGAFNLNGEELRKRGLNRIGNLLVPNDNYCKFEDWIIPIFDKMLSEQEKDNKVWTPSSMIDRLGQEINDESSILYWAHKNKIPIFCPALTDGSLGDMLYFHSFRSPGLVIDINQDIRKINTIAVRAKKTGIIILGGGVIKHHICNANLMRNGADYAVYINTGQEFDGSDAGASVTEAISWGKIKPSAKMVKVHADATIVFPIIVASTFASSS